MRTPRKFERENALSGTEMELLIKKQECQSINGDAAVSNLLQGKTLTTVIMFLTILGIVIGLAMAIKGALSGGQLSFYGAWARLIYFGGFTLTVFLDPAYADDNKKKYSLMVPHISGLILTGIQLIGVVQSYNCKDFISCL